MASPIKQWRLLPAILVLAAALLEGAPRSAHAIVGASTEAQSLTPFVVMVLERHGGVAGFCSGVVVAADVVLTAAHCAPPSSDLRVHFKESDGKPVLLPVAAVERHPGYRADAIKTRRRSVDLALLRLPAPLPARFRPATLGSMSSTSAGAAFGIAGFGVKREDDGTSSGTLRGATLRARPPLSSLLLWAEDPAAIGTGACTGDSGGPVFASGLDTVEAIMVWSAGAGPAKCGTLTQGLWLGPQRQWIDAILARWRSGR